MKRYIISILLAIPSQSFASVGNEIREVIEEGSGFFGFILAGLFGYVVGYPLLVCILCVKFLFSQNKPIYENSKKAASVLIDDFVQYFLLLFVFILPFVLILPAIFLFKDRLEKNPLILSYAIYTVISLFSASILTLRNSKTMKSG